MANAKMATDLNLSVVLEKACMKAGRLGNYSQSQLNTLILRYWIFSP